MTALVYNLTSGAAGGARPMGNAGPKPPANRPPHPSVGGTGHQRVPGQARTPTNWLAPMNPNQIRQQATKAVQSAYAPAFNEIGSQQARAQAIYDKQTSDNHYYLQWLATQTAALQAHNDAANSILTSAARDLTSQQQQLYSGQQQQLVNGADARAGNVSNNAQSNAFGSELYQNEQANEGLLNGTAQQALSSVDNSNTMMNELELAPAGTIAGLQAKQSSDLQTALDKLNTVSANLLTREGADTTSAIQNLQRNEIAKAEYNQNTAIAENKLGLQQADTQSLINQRAANTKIAAQNAKTAAGRLSLAQQHDAVLSAQGWARIAQSDKNYQLNVKKYNQSVAKDIYERNHGLGPYKPGKGSGPQYLGLASQNVIVRHIQAVSGQIDALVNQGMSPQDAYHAIQRGYYVINGKKYTTGIHEPDAVVLNAALNTSSHGSGLSPGDVQTLVREGIDPKRLKQLLKEAKPPSPQGAASTVLQDLSNWAG